MNTTCYVFLMRFIVPLMFYISQCKRVQILCIFTYWSLPFCLGCPPAFVAMVTNMFEYTKSFQIIVLKSTFQWYLILIFKSPPPKWCFQGGIIICLEARSCPWVCKMWKCVERGNTVDIVHSRHLHIMLNGKHNQCKGKAQECKISY